MKAMSPTLICFALKEEAGVFRRTVASRPGVSVLITGIGQKNAACSVREFLTQNVPRLVLTCGFAGGLNPELSPGDVVFSTTAPALEEKLTAAGAKPAKIFSADKIAITVDEKRELRCYTGADAVEMESGAIQTLCRERGIVCATVRVISDTANEDLPLDFNLLSKPDRSVDFVKLSLALLKQPGKVPALMRLQKSCSFAARKLADVLIKVV